MSENLEVDTIVKSASSLSRNRKVRGRDGMATHTHYALVDYFDGEDPTGAIKSRSREFLATAIAVVRGEDIDAVRAYLTAEESSANDLAEELETAFEEILGEEDAPEVTGSVGPILPYVLAILRNRDDIDGVDAANRALGES